jgi:hypothetical protein
MATLAEAPTRMAVTDEKAFQYEVRLEMVEAENDYVMMEVFTGDQSNFCGMLYCYFVDDHNAAFLFANTWHDPTDEALKDQNWMTSRR